MIRKYLPKSTEELIHWYERYVAPIALIAGFLLDTFVFLDRVDVLFGNLLLLSYLALAGAGIVLLNTIEAGRIRHRYVLATAPFIPVVIQFTFGGLFSGYLSLYSRSAGALLSWVFVVALALLLVGNERFRRLYVRPAFQLSVYFTALFSFLIFFLPVIVKKIGPFMFILSGILSVGIIIALLYVLRRLAAERIMGSWNSILRSLATIFVVFHILYFANLIPPLPLALKEADVYHSVERIAGAYHLQAERSPWYVRFLNVPGTFHRAGSAKTYVYSAVFAPSGLTTVIRHQWQYFDPDRDEWMTRSDVRFPIHGGRGGGFRGYSEKQDLADGSWRVNVLTEFGQTIGRVRFTVESASATPPLIEVLR